MQKHLGCHTETRKNGSLAVQVSKGSKALTRSQPTLKSSAEREEEQCAAKPEIKADPDRVPPTRPNRPPHLFLHATLPSFSCFAAAPSPRPQKQPPRRQRQPGSGNPLPTNNINVAAPSPLPTRCAEYPSAPNPTLGSGGRSRRRKDPRQRRLRGTAKTEQQPALF